MSEEVVEARHASQQSIADAYARGDHRMARRLAHEALARESEESATRESARRLLAETTPDPFLFVVGMMGVGLVVWLVYKYVL